MEKSDDFGDMMRSVFSDNIPKWPEFAPKLRTALADHRRGLEEIAELISDHIRECQQDDCDECDDAWTTAFGAVEGIIEQLPVDDTNLKRLLDYIQSVDSFNAYDRLLTDFSHLMADETRSDLAKKGDQIFVPEAVSHWSDCYRASARGG